MSKIAKHLLKFAQFTGTIQIDDEEYSVNNEFKESTIQLADALDLDEIEAAKLLLNAQEETDLLDRPALALAVIHFHKNRLFLLECLRLVLKQAADEEEEEDIRNVLRQLVILVLDTKDGPQRNGSLYTQKCFNTMRDAERWLQALAERVQGGLTLGRTTSPVYEEIIEFQQLSLAQQHESLSAIITYLVRASHTGVEDFYKVLEYMPQLDRWNNVAIHYVPIIAAFTFQYGSPEANGSLRDARALHTRIFNDRDANPWTLRNLQAAAISWWLAEYSGWYNERPIGSPLQGVNLELEAQARSEAFIHALNDGSFQCTLSICSQMKPNEWYEPARDSLTRFLIHDTPLLPAYEVALTSAYFQDIVMEQFETFADAFITNMPDTLRKFQVDEDDQRIRLLSGLKSSGQTSISEHDLHLERFLVIIAYAYDHRAAAAESFWADTDSNLYGFLQWASRRQSTPRVGAFCEMLRAISEGEENASAAHNFLLEEGSTTSLKLRRTSPLSWAQIFGELEFYSAKIHEHPMAISFSQYGRNTMNDEIDEPESGLMLECYLRLTSHLCNQSTTVRMWILGHPSFRLMDVLFYLCNNAVPNRVQACAFAVIRALMLERPISLSQSVWITVDAWISGALSPPSGTLKSTRAHNASVKAEDSNFDAIAVDFEKANEFIGLLQTLVSPAADDTGLNDQLPFPEQLGSSYRMPGIEPYVDFVIGKVFALDMHHLEDMLQIRILRWTILNFAATCLSTFNEDLVVLANKSTMSVDAAMNTSSLLSYVRLHPFHRVMEWMFNERVLLELFDTSHQDINEVSNAPPDSPLILSLLRSIDVINLVMDLQSTYFDIVRPLIKLQSSARGHPVLDPALASFEDSIANNLGLIVDLGLYSGVGNQELAVSSLKLLGKLASSRKLNAQTGAGLSQRLNSNRLIGILEQQNELERVARSLTLLMQVNPRELCQGPSSPAYIIKSVILDFLTHCLAVSPSRSTLAHALLGFTCTGSMVDINPEGLFAKGLSLFHAILRLVTQYPDGDEESMLSWMLNLRQKTIQVLSILWTSELTSTYTLLELRASDFLFAFFLRQTPIEPGTLFDGLVFRDPSFLFADSATALERYVRQRNSLLDLISAEIRLASIQGAPSLKARILSTLLGSTTTLEGEQLPNMTIFDLLDFLDLELPSNSLSPRPQYFSGIDFDISAGLDSSPDSAAYDIKLVEELLALRMNEIRKSGRLQDANEEQRVLAEAQSLVLYFQGENNKRSIEVAKTRTLKSWVGVLALVIEKCELDQASKSSLILQAIQVVTPKLERYAADHVPEAIDLANLMRSLLFQLDFQSSPLEGGRASDAANDRLFHVFRIALRTIHMPDGDPEIREILYNICSRYLIAMSAIQDAPLKRRHSTQTVKSAGERLIDIICDDAYGGAGTCRISATLLLDSLVALAKTETSSYLLDSLVRTNFIVVIVETIKDIPLELRETGAQGKPLLPVVVSSWVIY